MTSPKVATEPLYFNEDRTKLVKAGDPAARFLAAAVGDEIPEVEKPAPEAKPAAPVEKQAAKADDKAVTTTVNKSA